VFAPALKITIAGVPKPAVNGRYVGPRAAINIRLASAEASIPISMALRPSAIFSCIRRCARFPQTQLSLMNASSASLLTARSRSTMSRAGIASTPSATISDSNGPS
jgi:hypothetical protein